MSMAMGGMSMDMADTRHLEVHVYALRVDFLALSLAVEKQLEEGVHSQVALP